MFEENAYKKDIVSRLRIYCLLVFRDKIRIRKSQKKISIKSVNFYAEGLNYKVVQI